MPVRRCTLVIALMQKYEGISLKELRAELSKVVVDKNAVQKRWSMWTHDLYYQYGRIGGNEVRKELGLQFCLYEGVVFLLDSLSILFMMLMFD